MDNLAIVLRDQGKYDEAEAMSGRELAARETTLGHVRLDTLTSVNSLTTLLEVLGNFEDATISYQRALPGYNKVSIPKHPTTMACSKQCSSLLGRNSGVVA